MTDYKQAGDLVPGDIFIKRRRYRGVVREQTYRVVAVLPGAASTVIDVIAVVPGRQRRMFGFYRGNRVEMVGSRNLHFVRLAGED
jgi:hypothetical protein